jgi:hypothetical protein
VLTAPPPGQFFLALELLACAIHGPGHPGAAKRPSRFPMKIHFVWWFYMGAQGAEVPKTAVSGPGSPLLRGLFRLDGVVPDQQRPPGLRKRARGGGGGGQGDRPGRPWPGDSDPPPVGFAPIARNALYYTYLLEVTHRWLTASCHPRRLRRALAVGRRDREDRRALPRRHAGAASPRRRRRCRAPPVCSPHRAISLERVEKETCGVVRR